MKKFFGFLIVAIAMTACSSDDDSNPITTSVEGNWKMTAMNMQNAHDLNEDGTASRNLMDETNCYQNETILFKADGTGVFTSNSYADIELEFVFGSTDEYDYIIECVSETEITLLNYIQNGEEVTMTVEGESITASISGNTLTYVIPNGFFVEVEDPESGTITVTEDLTFIYTKQ